MKIQQKSETPSSLSPSSSSSSSHSLKSNQSLSPKQHILLWTINAFLVFIIVRSHSVIEDSKMPDSMRIIRVYETRELSMKKNVTGPKVVSSIDWDRPINCSLLGHGNRDEIRRARHHAVLKQPGGYSEFMNMVDNCSKLIEDHEYVMYPLSKEEEEFPIAFAIRMHKNIIQFEQLLRALYMPQNVYCVHIDLKSPKYVHRAIQNLVKCFPNVFIATRLQYYVYESSSPVWADLQCMEDLTRTNVQWKYFLNLPGQEFPLKTNLEMVRILKFLNGTNDIETFPLPQEFFHRVNNIHFIVEGKVLLSDIRKADFRWTNVQLRKGNAYNSFSRPFVEWLLVNQIARDLYYWANDTATPDELVWATLNTLPDAPGGYNLTVVQPHRQIISRTIDWAWASTQCRLRHYVHQICIFSSADLHHLLSRGELFANKFDLSYDSVVVDCLEEELKHRRKLPLPDKHIQWDWIKSLPHVKARLSHGAN